MIDIHSHILPNVDDGSSSLKSSIQLIKNEVEIGVSKIILTPHYKTDSFLTEVSKIKNEFEILKEEVKKENINIELYLGQEIYVSENTFDLLKDGKVLTLNDTNVVLIEFNYFTEIDILDCVCNFVALGYRPIIAHIERYAKVKGYKKLLKLIADGYAIAHVNAGGVISKESARVCEKLEKFLKYTVHILYS